MDNESVNTYGTPQTPDLSDSLVARRPAIRDASHAKDILEGLFEDNDARTEEASLIREKADGIVPPLDAQKLAEEGKSHKKNFSTGFLGSVIDRIIPRLVMRVKASMYLTSAKLPASFENSAQKTDVFRRAVTDAIRNWSGWNFFLYNLADQDVKFGKAFVAYLEKGEWRPQVMRLDDFAIPNGTKQGESPDYAGMRPEYSVSEMFAFIEGGEDVARAAGWDVDNVVKAINEARPVDKAQEEVPSEAALSYQDIELELVKSQSFGKDWNSVRCGVVFAKEYDGSASCYIINRENGDELFKMENMYNSMADAVEAVCYDIGNGTVYGSMGVGQKLYDLALNLEKSRNQAFDQLSNRGKIFLVVNDASDLNRVKTTVTDEYVYISGADISNAKAALPDNAEAFITLDRYTRGLAEEKVGAYQPESVASDKTATQSRIDALKEAETTDARLDFWLTYVGRVVSMMQRRMMNPETQDPVAIAARNQCLAVMNEQELQLLANMPPAQTGIDWTQAKQAQQVAFLQTKIGNPRWDQDAVERTLATMTIGSDLTESLMLPPNDQTEMIEAMRQQQDESFTMSAQGVPVLVSPRDNHVVHMQALSGEQVDGTDNWSGQIFALLQEGNVQGAGAALQHYQAHFVQAEQREILGEYQNVAKKFMSDAARALQKANEINQEYAQREAEARQAAGV